MQITDEMVEAACSALDPETWAYWPEQFKAKERPRMRKALEAALSAQDGAGLGWEDVLEYVRASTIVEDGTVGVKALEEIERLYWVERKDAGWRAAQMKGVARSALEEITSPSPAQELPEEPTEEILTAMEQAPIYPNTRDSLIAIYHAIIGAKK